MPKAVMVWMASDTVSWISVNLIGTVAEVEIREKLPAAVPEETAPANLVARCDGVVTACEFVGGCPGNTQGVAKLVVGRKVEEVIALLKGIQCRAGTSCPDQLSRALEKFVAQRKEA